MPKFSALAQGPGVTPGHPMTQLGSTPRASYHLLQYNTHCSQWSAGALDANLRPLFQFNSNSFGTSQNNATYQYAQYATTSTYNPVATNSDHLQSTMLTGEFGFDCVLFRERQYAPEPAYSESMGGNLLEWLNRSFVNSDHLDRSRVLTLSSGVLVSSPLHAPVVRSLVAPPYFRPEVSYKLLGGSAGTGMPSGHGTSGMVGSASFSRVRKELVVVANNTANNGTYDVMIWKNVDLDAWGMDVSRIPDAPSVVRSFTIANVNGNNMYTGRNEERYHPKVVLCDDGSIYVASMSTTYTTNNFGGFRLFKLTRPADDSTLTSTYQALQGSSTSYGAENGIRYGSRAIQDKTGSLVMAFSPYYYYGAGINLFVIDRRTGQYRDYQNSSTSIGNQPFKFGAGSIGLSAVGNLYANSSGATLVFRPGEAGGNGVPGQAQGPRIPYGLYPATWDNSNYYTNYLGICPVWELPTQPALPA